MSIPGPPIRRKTKDGRGVMAKLIVSEFMTMDGVMQAPGGKDEG
jgi:hypothetical protein